MAIVGDSQAHSLAVNLPDGIESTFTVTDGSLDGCSVYDAGRVRSARTSFRNYVRDLRGLAATVGRRGARAPTPRSPSSCSGRGTCSTSRRATARASTFGTPAWDDHVRAQPADRASTPLVGAGAQVALLEVPCMRPISAEGAGVPPLPERGDDARVAHVNELFRAVAAANAGTSTFVEGPDAWCADEAIATDVGMRWDGVHVYKPGAKLIYDTIAPALARRCSAPFARLGDRG